MATSSNGEGSSADPVTMVSIPDAKHLVDIVSYLDVPGLNSMMRTSKAFHVYIRSDDVWEPHLKQMLGRVFDTLVDEGEEEKTFTKQPTWKDSSTFLEWADKMLSFSDQSVLGHLRQMEWNNWDLDDNSSGDNRQVHQYYVGMARDALTWFLPLHMSLIGPVLWLLRAMHEPVG